MPKLLLPSGEKVGMRGFFHTLTPALSLKGEGV
jgi:hypothetical protein